jgi:hypothetical protein
MSDYTREASRLRLVRMRLSVPLEWGESCAAPCCARWHGMPRDRGRVVQLVRVWTDPPAGDEVVALCALHYRRFLATLKKDSQR